MNSNLVLLIFLILLSGVFSGAEIALTSISQAKVRALADDGKFASRAIVNLKKRPQSFLVAVLIGNNVVNILATVIATIWGMEVFGNHVVGIITGALTFIILVFGEITPKTFAQKFSVPFARAVAYPLSGMIWLLYPLIWIFVKFTSLLMKLFRLERSFTTMSEEEILAMVDIGTEEGVIKEHEQELIENVLELDETTVEEVMTVDKDIYALESSATIKKAARFFVDHFHSRIPVYKGTLDNVIGIITVHDILDLIHQSGEAEKTLGELEYPPVIVVPTTKAVRALFKEFQKRHQHMAIAVDDRGSTAGLVTMEDILEEIVGDITDEEDREEKVIYKIDKNTWEADGEALVEDINKAACLELSYPEHETISMLILEQLHRFPTEGEKINYEGLVFQVTKMSRKQIETVRITKP